MKTRLVLVFGVILAAGLLAFAVRAQPTSAQGVGAGTTGPFVNAPVRPVSSDTDLRALPAQPGRAPRVRPQFPARALPPIDVPGMPGQTSAAAAINMPAPTVNFLGLTFSGNCGGTQCGAGWPPDTNGDVGPNNYVETVNTAIGIFSKTGTPQSAVTVNSFFAPLGTSTPCGNNLNDGDPISLYDPLADRWLISDFAFSVDFFGNPTGPFYQCIGVSKTGNPVTGGWWLYALLADNTTFPDYPKLGVWPDAYYLTANMFNLSTGAQTGTRMWALNRSAMLNGQPLSTVFFNTTVGSPCCITILPGNLRGAAPPTAGEPEFLAGVDQPSTLHLFKFHYDTVTPGNSTLTGPINLTVNSFAMPCNAGATRACVPEQGGEALDSVGDRLMMQLQYRNINGVESLWANHSVANSSSTGSVIGVRWYEVRGLSGTPSIFQQGTFMPDSTYRWMGSLAVDQSGNMALGYSASNSTMFPAIRYTGRLVTDALGTLPQGEATLIAGTGAQNGGGNRWGDYSAMSVDPVDGCTFWYTQEYYAATGTNWQTRIGSFKYPSCGSTAATATPTNMPTNTPVPPTNTPVPPTNTPLPPTATPTGTRINTPTNTPVPPTNTPVPPTNTPVPPTSTPTRTPAPTNTPIPGGTNVVVNPGFETQPPGTGWTEYSSGGYQLVDTYRPHTGSYSADLCGYNYCTEYIQQRITIPSSATLTYWWYMTSSEGTTTPYDYMYVRLYNTSGTLVATLRTWSNMSTRNAWSQDSIGLSAYAGQTLILRFQSTTDFSLVSNFFVDDVSVK